METGLSPSIGTLLKQARVVRALTINDIQDELRVRQRYLVALEADDLGALPPGVYARALIRQYAAFLGLDPFELLARYGRARPIERDSVRPSLPVLDRPPLVSLKAVVTVLVVASCIGLFVYLQAQYNSYTRSVDNGGGVTQSALPTTKGRSALLTPFPTAVIVPPTAAALATPVSGLVVEARAIDRSWIEAWVDGSSAMAETLPGGSLRTFTGRHGIRLRVGNAGGVEVLVNGVSQGTLGQRGQAVEAAWTFS
ncbi:MAG: helix-turn-helix domain-containing protein [Chloroflexi bacterium]|nr:helix-turn-helix domain-containing protein [Chloroflexota bacterium]